MKRAVLTLTVIPVIVVYIVSERRSAFVALSAAIVLLFVVLFRRRRRVFWFVAPVVLVLSVGYLGAFWNASSSSLGYPAQAVKSVVAPGQLSEKDQSSDNYRKIESANILFTIRTNRLMGIGFGRPFYRPFVLPDISFFVFANYMTHNSILWIWMQAGIGAFLAMLYLFGATLRNGARALKQVKDVQELVWAFASVSFVLMYALYAYVDIGWDMQNMLILAVAMAHIDFILRRPKAVPVVAEQPVSVEEVEEPVPAMALAVSGSVGAAPTDEWPSSTPQPRARQEASVGTPTVSVVVPTYNRLARLQEVLEALGDQTYPRESYEVIVVSDGSTDGTDDFLALAGLPGTRFASQPNSGPAAARNLGVTLAQRDVVLFVDDDVIASPTLVEEHARMHAGQQDLVVIGPMLTPDGYEMAPWVRWEQAMLLKQYSAMERGDYDATYRQFYTGNASASRAIIVAAGGFNTAYRRAEDLEAFLPAGRIRLPVRLQPGGHRLPLCRSTVPFLAAQCSGLRRERREVHA